MPKQGLVPLNIREKLEPLDVPQARVAQSRKNHQRKEGDTHSLEWGYQTLEFERSRPMVDYYKNPRHREHRNREMDERRVKRDRDQGLEHVRRWRPNHLNSTDTMSERESRRHCTT